MSSKDEMLDYIFQGTCKLYYYSTHVFGGEML